MISNIGEICKNNIFCQKNFWGWGTHPQKPPPEISHTHIAYSLWHFYRAPVTSKGVLPGESANVKGQNMAENDSNGENVTGSDVRHTATPFW